MKLVSYLFAFYLILLSAIPCCALDNCPDDNTTQSTTHEKKEKDCGNCSPFFNCEGCAMAVIVYEPLHVGIPAIKILSVHTSYIQLALPTIDFEFWQPPKIG